jgi:hypothetical protein
MSGERPGRGRLRLLLKYVRLTDKPFEQRLDEKSSNEAMSYQFPHPLAAFKTVHDNSAVATKVEELVERFLDATLTAHLSPFHDNNVSRP